ncbi:MAG: MotA/TolQ/ExbB proton channel family protein [Pseudomonadota bacterium]
MLDLDWNFGATAGARPAFADIQPERIVAKVKEDPYRYLLLLRLAGYNLAGLMLLAGAFLEGWVGMVLEADSSGLVLVIAAIFAVGMVVTAHRAIAYSNELNAVRANHPTRGSKTAAFLDQTRHTAPEQQHSLESALRIRTVGEIAQIRHLAGSLVLLGLIGTILGFIMALGAVDPQKAGDVAAVAPMISGLIEGLGVALYTTLVGAVLNIWLMMNFRIVEGAASRWIARLTERSASHAWS